MTPAAIGRIVAAQVGALIGVAALADVPVRYVKPHGALGNLAARDPEVARAIAASVRALNPDLAILRRDLTAGGIEIAPFLAR